MELSCGMIEINMRDSLRKIIYKVLGITYGSMEDNIKVHGETIKCMVKVSSIGLMEGVTKDNMSTTKNKAMDNLTGLMDAHIKDIGKMVNKMEKEHIETKKVWRKMVHGSMVRK